MKPRLLERMLQKILVLSTILTMLLSPMALAPSHPVFFDEETGETIDTILGNEWVDPGITPDSFLWQVDLWWEDVTNVPPEEQLQERLAEAHELMEVIEFTETTTTDTIVLGVQAALAEAQTVMTAVEAEFEAVEGDADNIDTYGEHTETAVALGEQVDALTQELEQAIAVAAPPVDSPAAAAVEAVEISLDNLQDEVVAVSDAVAEEREEIVDDIAEVEGITHIEAEITLEVRETETGIALVHELAVQDELAEVGEELTALRESIDTAQAAGETVDTATLQLLHEATAHFEHAQEAIEDGNWGQAFGQLTATEHITENAEDHLERQEEIPLELDPSAVREERLAEVRQFLEEAPPLLAARPDDPELTVLTDNVQVLQQELQVEDKVTELLTAGRLPEEVYEAAAPEIAHIFGRTDFIPSVFTGPGGEAVTRLADFDAVAANLQTTGGFVQGIAYADPASGYKFEFTENGYEYTTPFGTKHEQKFPEGFVDRIPDAYATGREQHTYPAPDGHVYTYNPLGYSITTPAGTTESFSYDLGKYEMPGGGKIEIDPRGYALLNELGRQKERMEYVPEFGSYVSAVDGTTFRSEALGMKSIHDEAIHYDYDNRNYVFNPEKAADYFSRQYEQVGFPGLGVPGPGPGEPGGPGRAVDYTAARYDKWTYDPLANSWTNVETGKTQASQATTIAPVGHEEQGIYSTDYGETWTYDAATRGWTSEKGETFVSSHEGSSKGSYTDIGKNTYDYSHEGTFTDPGTGVAWSYDGSTHGWTSVAEGGIAGPAEGAAPGTVGSVAPSTGTAVDAQGNVWSYTPGLEPGTGTWSSPTYTGTEGHTGYTDSTGTATGGAYSAPPGMDAGGHTGGMDGGTSGGTGGMTGGDTGGMTGGDSGGGGTGGGDSGGGGTGGGDGGGGHSGGDGGGGGGGGGMVVREIRPAKELHPVTKFLLKYLGIKG